MYKILYLDDSTIALKMMKKALEGFADTLCVATIAEAMDAVEINRDRFLLFFLGTVFSESLPLGSCSFSVFFFLSSSSSPSLGSS